jgi:transposase
MYDTEHLSTNQIGEKLGVSGATVIRWLGEYNVPIRTSAESILPKDFKKPTMEELKKMYEDEYLSASKIGKRLGVTESAVLDWLRNYEIPTRTRVSMGRSFNSLLEADKVALALAYAATNSNDVGFDFEKIMMEAYGGKFKDQKQLHDLLEQNAEHIKKLVESGVTNLGAYIGRFSLGDRRIFPLIAEGAIDAIPDSMINTSLEERMARILRISYSPRFNDNPQKTLKELEIKTQTYEGKRNEIYQKLVEHYKEVQKIGEELR